MSEMIVMPAWAVMFESSPSSMTCISAKTVGAVTNNSRAAIISLPKEVWIVRFKICEFFFNASGLVLVKWLMGQGRGEPQPLAVVRIGCA